VLQRVQFRDGISVIFVWVWRRIWGVIFSFPLSFSDPLLLRLYRRWQFAVIVIACKSGPVAYHQSPSNFMPHLTAATALLASSSTAGTWLVPRYVAYFQFLTDGNEQYDILNIHSATEIFLVKKGSENRKKTERKAHPKPTTVSQSSQWLMR
jgi:hypothetical protein